MKDDLHYVDHMTPKELIRYIANDPPELSRDKIKLQRDDFIKICKRWLEVNESKSRIRFNS